MLKTDSLIRNEKAVIQWEHWKFAWAKNLDKHDHVQERATLKTWIKLEVNSSRKRPEKVELNTLLQYLKTRKVILLFEPQTNYRVGRGMLLAFTAMIRDTSSTAFAWQNSGGPILREEVENATRSMRVAKAKGEEGITAAFIVKIWDQVTDFFVFLQKIYGEREFPGEMRKSTITSLPQTTRALECTCFRTIALMSHLKKVLK